MWTRRRIFPTLEVPATPHPAALSTPLYHEQCSDKARVATFALEDNAFNFVAGLGYTLVPALGAEEAAALLSWALPPAWAGDAAVSADLRASRLATALHRAAALGACTQVEYFFIGTDNGHVFLMPLLPPHLLEALVAECGETTLPELAYLWKHETELAQAAARSDVSAARAIGQGSRAPLNCVGRRLLHRHAREEPVTVMDHLGTLFASAAPPGDTSVAVSMFHPLPASITCLPHPSAVRSIKLWEGSAFTASSSHSSSAEEYDTQRQGALQRWHDALRAAEPTAVYLFTGDYAGLVRLWRIDVAAHSYTLQHVLICSANMTGMLSPLTPFAREDNSKKVPSRDADRTVHCLEVDEQAGRVFAGTEGGVYVWAIDALPWRGPESVSANALAEHHPLCWDEERRAPLSCALLHYETSPPYDSDAGSTSPTASSTDSEKIVEYRASRLVNHHVWLLPASTVQSEMARAMERSGGSSADKVSKWKPKYGRVATGGAAVGVVCNTVKLSAVAAASAGASVGDRLTDTAVPVSFEGGELKNGLRVPLSCVVPVAYPLAFLRTPGTACFALRVLAGRRRLVTSCADGKVCVWACHHGKEASSAAVAETYVPQLVTSTLQEHRGLGRHICVLRTPDVFITCSYDDALVREWHVYDEPEALLRCARRFTLTPYSSEGSGVQQQQQQRHADALKKIPHPNMVNGATVDSDLDETWANGGEDGDVVGGISCAAAYPAFGALFLVGAFESAIQTYSLTEVVSCEPPRNYVYNGLKTVRLPASMAEDVYHELPTR
ncbi:conserved hypothetical protein [Leishmania braziliensis MHOM/BR/75/M2904]|uniref:Uncharacterized protein n=2 Tax=Leishmania braziliensis TaxID=5660 RepID=A4H7C2_LEIBR|nr:conserved hypothetical protein [Leishmania braziliensis MHOM/BR/75/M2904]KAI5688727.1 hypothetical protein MNV84_01795 [Leishmania braziliensis]CAJ2468805.1 unnamed protein product [Leishmania braziliensis]CAM45680.1 conserved hypothetical protein [Leishmania braziliensis MHOM/BR/75/M2904]